MAELVVDSLLEIWNFSYSLGKTEMSRDSEKDPSAISSLTMLIQLNSRDVSVTSPSESTSVSTATSSSTSSRILSRIPYPDPKKISTIVTTNSQTPAYQNRNHSQVKHQIT